MVIRRVLAAIKRGETEAKRLIAGALKLIRRAIRDRLLLRIVYDGHERIVEPHQLVFATDGMPWVDANQTEGGSPWAGAPGPDGVWLRFSLAKIESIELLDETCRVRDSFNPDAPVHGRVEARV